MARKLLQPNLVFNGDFEIAPAFTAATNTPSKWIDGTSAGNSAQSSYGWAPISLGASADAYFDSSTFHSGLYSMRLDTLDASGSVVVASYGPSSPTTQTLIPLSANTAYMLTAWVKTSNVAANAAWLDFREYNSSLSAVTTTSSSKLSGTNGWQQLTVTATTSGTTVGGAVLLRNGVAGNIGTAWFDDVILSPTAAISRSSA